MCEYSNDATDAKEVMLFLLWLVLVFKWFMLISFVDTSGPQEADMDWGNYRTKIMFARWIVSVLLDLRDSDEDPQTL